MPDATKQTQPLQLPATQPKAGQPTSALDPAAKPAAGATERQSQSPPAAANPPDESDQSATGASEGIDWQRNLEAAKREAAARNLLVLIHFEAPWARWCQPLEENVFRRKDVIDAVRSQYVPVRLDYDIHREIAKQYGVKGVPWEVIIDPSGDRVDDFNSPQTAEAFVRRINRVAAQPQDPGGLQALSIKKQNGAREAISDTRKMVYAAMAVTACWGATLGMGQTSETLRLRLPQRR